MCVIDRLTGSVCISLLLFFVHVCVCDVDRSLLGGGRSSKKILEKKRSSFITRIYFKGRRMNASYVCKKEG